MASGRKYPEELRQRAIRLVGEAREQDERLSQNAAVVRISKLVVLARTRCGCGCGTNVGFQSGWTDPPHRRDENWSDP
jgi:hypothetical protein